MTDEYKVGDLPPERYPEWYKWAEVQHNGGLEQVKCSACHKWLFPQEVAGHKCKKGERDD